jgi:hypothetical protein
MGDRGSRVKAGWASLALVAALLFPVGCNSILGIDTVSLWDGDAATTLLTHLNHPFWLVVDPTQQNLYFSEAGSTKGASDGAIKRCSVASCATTLETLASGLANPQTMAIDTELVYWVNGVSGDILSCGLLGCDNHPTTFLKATNAFRVGLAIDATSLYWVTDDSRLYKISKKDTMSAPTLLAGPSDGLVTPTLVYVDGDDLLISDTGNGDDPTTNIVWRISNTGKGLTRLVTHAACPCSFASDDKNDYWSAEGNDLEDGTLVKLAKPGPLIPDSSGGPKILKGQSEPIALALDPPSGDLYLANLGSGTKSDGSIVRMPAAGGTATTLASDLPTPNGLVVVGDQVFVITSAVPKSSGVLPPSTGTLISIAK